MLFCVVPVPSSSCTESGIPGSCDHYQQCVEPLLECGQNGFTLSFGMAHCQAVERLRSNITTPWLAEWLGDHEMCLKQKLQELAQAQTCPSPDPPTCLQFEISALRAFEDCFRRNTSLLCQSDELANNPSVLGEEIHYIAQEIGVSGYFTGAIAAAIFRAINDTCTHPNTSHVLEPVSSLTATRHTVFCTIISGSDATSAGSNDTNISRSPQIIAKELHRPVESFKYIGTLPSDYNALCNDAAPQPIQNLPNPEYHFVTWSPSSSDPLPDNLSSSYIHYITSSIIFDFFSLHDLRSNNTCGDGIRQAGELCDTGVMNFFGGEGCNSDCRPHENYECDTTQLEGSLCRPTTCGDGLRTSNEECDDHNNETGDGCSNCKVEAGYDCSKTYNATSICSFNPISITTTDASSTPTIPPSTTTRLIPTSPPPTETVGASAKSTTRSCQYFVVLLVIATQIIAWFDSL